ncbi:hypothetical protein BDW02DRAFT_473951, partial [Decorospora gaudefroyi]
TTMSGTSSVPTLTPHQVLFIHLIIWQQAVFAYPIPKIKNIVSIQGQMRSDFPIWLFTPDFQSARSCADPTRFDQDRIYRALVMSNWCDTFCVTMEPMVKRAVRDLFRNYGPVQSIRFIPKPHLLLVRSARDVHRDVGHSCLQITDGNGEKFVFDGTTDQFGLDWKTHWLMPRREIEENHMKVEHGFSMLVRWKEDEAGVLLGDPTFMHGYWIVARGRMEELFQEMEWSSFCGLSEADIEIRVRALGQSKFKGAYEEAE